ncbi:Nn.00g087240.m01.CDS01 [Neocucurbitaria sp. VM-36]
MAVGPHSPRIVTTNTRPTSVAPTRECPVRQSHNPPPIEELRDRPTKNFADRQPERAEAVGEEKSNATATTKLVAMDDPQRVRHQVSEGIFPSANVPIPRELLSTVAGDLDEAGQWALTRLLPEEHINKHNEDLEKRRRHAVAAKKEHLDSRLAKLSKREEKNTSHVDAFQSADSTRIGSPDSINEHKSGCSTTSKSTAEGSVDTEPRQAPVPESTLTQKDIIDFINTTETELEASASTESFSAGLGSVIVTGKSTANSSSTPPNEDVVQTAGCPLSGWEMKYYPSLVVFHGPYITEYPWMTAECQDETTGR